METYLNGIKSGTVAVNQFGGLNLTPSCSFSEFEEMENTKTDDFPVLSTRNDRQKLLLEISDVSGIKGSFSGFTKYSAIDSNKELYLHALYTDPLSNWYQAPLRYVYLSNGVVVLHSSGYITGGVISGYVSVVIRFDTTAAYTRAKGLFGFTETHANPYNPSDISGNFPWTAYAYGTKLQSNVAYLDGYFYYVRNSRFCRRMAIANATEEVIINHAISGKQTVQISGRKVIVVPKLVIYDLDKDIVIGDGLPINIAYKDIELCCISTDTTRGGEFKIVIKDALGVYLAKLANYIDTDITYTFTTKTGVQYAVDAIYDGEDDNGCIQTLPMACGVTSGLTDAQKEFVTNCVTVKYNNYAVNMYGNPVKYEMCLKKDLFDTEKGAVLQLSSLNFDTGFNMKFSTPYNNRFFACNVEGDCVYSSAIGAPYDFQSLEEGEASADWISVMSSGVFTGMAAFGGNVFYFKEHCVHKLYGSSPSDWQLVELPINGVENGAENSIAVENDYCIYKSTDGFYLFDGLTATKISDKLGRYMEVGSSRYSSAIFKGKYYCAVTDCINGMYTLFTYDVSNGLWSCEEYNAELDTITDAQIMKTERDVYLIKYGTSSAEILALNANREFEFDGEWTDTIPWSVQTGRLDASIPYNKYFSKIAIRAEGDGSTVTAKVIGKGASRERSFTFTPTDTDTFTYAFKPMRCDSMKLKLSGTGKVKIHSITVFLSEGSEIR